MAKSPFNHAPNILLVTTDQQRTDSLSGYGAAWTQTPHLDRLTVSGVFCERAYCTSPVCTPSRALILAATGVTATGVAALRKWMV